MATFYQVFITGSAIDLLMKRIPKGYSHGKWIFYIGFDQERAMKAMEVASKQGFWPPLQTVEASEDLANDSLKAFNMDNPEKVLEMDRINPHPLYLAELRASGFLLKGLNP